MSNTATNYKSFIIKAVIICVTIALGIYFGMFISVKTGLTNGGGQPSLTPDNMRNTTNLEIGDQLPPIEISDIDGNPVMLNDLLRGHKTILAFVSDGCEPCHDFIADIISGETGEAEPDQVVLLSGKPEAFTETGDLPIYRISHEVMTAFEIHSMPTIIGIDGMKDHNIIKVVTTGYGHEFTFAVINKFL